MITVVYFLVSKKLFFQNGIIFSDFFTQYTLVQGMKKYANGISVSHREVG